MTDTRADIIAAHMGEPWRYTGPDNAIRAAEKLERQGYKPAGTAEALRQALEAASRQIEAEDAFLYSEWCRLGMFRVMSFRHWMY